MNHWKWFISLWRDHKIFALFLLFVTLLSTAVFIGYPLFFRYLIDELGVRLANENPGEIHSYRTKVLLIFLAIGLVRLLTSLYPFFRARMNLLFEKNIREKYFRLLMSCDQKELVNFRTGDLVTRLTDDLTNYPKVSWFACSGFFRAINSLSMVLVCIATLFWIHPTLAGISLIPIPMVILVFMALSSRLRRSFDKLQKTVSFTNNHMEACFSGIRILKAYNSEDRESSRFGEVLDDRKQTETKAVHLQGAMQLFYEFVNYVSQALVIGVGGYFVIQNQMSIGDYYAFFTYLGMIVYPMMDIPNLLVSSRQAFVCVDRLEEISQAAQRSRPELEDRNDRATEGIQELEFKRVNFHYKAPQATDDNPESSSQAFALQELSFRVERGERLAIIGKIGAGKTTLLNLLAGIIKPDYGEILINQKPLGEKSLKEWRNQIGYIGQEPIVFSETILSNIRFFREYSMAAVEKSATIARFHQEIQAFDQGYNQVIGQRGVSISGGQKQRLTIARALVKQPSILVMDDVTASLDAENEEEFWNHLDQNQQQSTVILVTHRMATARRADRIILLDQGKIQFDRPASEVLKSYTSLEEILQN